MHQRVRQLALLATLLAVATVDVLAQNEGRRQGNRGQRRRDTIEPLSDTARLTRRATEANAVAARFWRDTTPMELTLTVNLRQLRGDRSPNATWRRATLAYTVGGRTDTMPLQIRTRGIWRLKNCQFPPLRLNFAERAIKGTIFEGVNRPKMVNACNDDDRSEQYVLKEFQLYRVHNVVTEASHHARLARVTVVDSASGRRAFTRWGFLIEEPDAVAARLRGIAVEQEGARSTDLEPRSSAIMGVFQYLIGNTDFSISNLHNVELVRVDFGVHVPVAYDFDFAGAVDAHYARPPEILPIRRVTERIYRGECVPAEEIDRAVALMHEKKDAIYALYRDAIGRLLPEGTVSSTLRFYDEFFRDTSDPRTVKRRITDVQLGCR